ncbi:MAG: class I adenylate-forming enzyme family protein [Pseudomonadales bacterium]|jgi:long-chain acyl-CoA synthetase|tara:strand:+ start:9006 stop:10580 length:1575 start_codon:yes stop_codon:yes gene_type:complete
MSPITEATLDQPDLLYTDLIRINAELYGAKPAVVCGEERLSWRDFHARSNSLANLLLKLGVCKGDRVCLVMDSSILMFELLWGVVKMGGVVVPLNIMMNETSLVTTINDCKARLLVASSRMLEALRSIESQFEHVHEDLKFADYASGGGWRDIRPLIESSSTDDCGVQVSHSDSMNIIYSSGSTGDPKGIEHSHFSRHIYSLGFGPGLRMDRFSRPICTTPLYTNGTWITMLPAVYWGGTTILMSKFNSEEFFCTVERERATHVFMVPTQYIVLTGAKEAVNYDLTSMRVCLSGGQAIAEATKNKLTAVFPAGELFECYGLTEGFITLAGPEDKSLPGKGKTVGLPMFGGEIVILDEEDRPLPAGTIGDIAGYGPALMKGYFNKTELTSRSIWHDPSGRSFLKSGDLGYLDEDGYLYISGRIKDMIKSGGMNIYASDIEEVFMQHPDVIEVAAIGIPHDKWVETPLLLAIMRDGSSISSDELRKWGNAKLGKWQRVSEIEFRISFPRATHDKILKRALRDSYWT